MSRFRPLRLLLILASLVLVAAVVLTRRSAPVERWEGAQATSHITKPVSFAILEDYDKGDDLETIALDFQLMNELGIHTLRCSFGWDDYEPQPGEYDFVWLEEFVALASEYDIQLRPYLGYTPAWAGVGGADDAQWNDPPAQGEAWYNFVYHLASALSDNPNVLSYEIYNEENTAFWWEGTVEQYGETLRLGARAVRAADPDAQVLLGGLVFPDDDWLLTLIEAGDAQHYDIVPFHAYPETWTEADVTVETYLDTPQYQDFFVAHNNDLGEGEPIWINEMGFATVPGKSERDQANWWARAVSTYLAEPEIEHIGVYEIKDLNRDDPALGGDANYYLGLTYPDRRKKLAFGTVDMLTDLLDVGTLTVADGDAHVSVTLGQAEQLYSHLFVRPDGVQVLFVYDKVASPTVRIALRSGGSAAFHYQLDGSASPYPDFDGHTLEDVRLAPGEVAIFRLDP